MTKIIECTKATPWDQQPLPNTRVRHHEVEEVGQQEDGYPGGDIQKYKCKNCGQQWKEELPQ